jgi:hypothetical protein
MYECEKERMRVRENENKKEREGEKEKIVGDQYKEIVKKRTSCPCTRARNNSSWDASNTPNTKQLTSSIFPND